MLRVSSFPAGGLHCAVPAVVGTASAFRRRLAARNQTRRIQDHGQAPGRAVTLYSRTGKDLTQRFPLIVEAVGHLRLRSCMIDGEAVVCDDGSVPSFDLLRRRSQGARGLMYAFDLIELNGDDLRREPIEARKEALARSLTKVSTPGLQYNEHVEDDGATVFLHACRLGLEGIVSKLKGRGYQSGRSPHWIKSKNPASVAARREAEEDWY
jgi:bifunctional non-homologous end joining protein LigD